MNDMRGIAQLLQAQGRHGDTMLAHITPEEAGLLKLLGGSGTINPETGLPEFWWNPFTWFRDEVLEPAVEFVQEKVFDPVFEFVEEKVIDPILDNPVKAALKAAAIATGNAWAVPVIEGADVARQGGDAGDILAATAASYAMGQASGAVGNVISPEVASAVNSLGLDPATAQVLTDSASRALTSGALAAAKGGDVGAAMTDGAIQGAFKSFTGPTAPTQQDIDSIMNLGGTPEQIALTQDIESFMNLGGTPEQQADTALLDYQTQYEAELNKVLGAVPQDIHPIDIPQEPPTSYETGIGLPGEEAATQSLGGFGGTGNILGLEDYEEQAGKDLAAAQEKLAETPLPIEDVISMAPKIPLAAPKVAPPKAKLPAQTLPKVQQLQQSYNQMLDQYLASQPISVPFIANIPQTDLEEMFSGQTPIYWQGQA